MKLVGPWLLVGAAMAIASCAAGTLPGETGGGATSSSTTASSSSTQATGATGSSGGGGSATSTSATTGSGGQGSSGACTTAATCPVPASACLLATCTAGTCGTEAAAEGTVITKDTPADCKATMCDGTGNTMQGVDPSNVPISTNPCLVGTCDATGTAGTAPAAAGTTCTGSQGKVCDGAGACVTCLHDADCIAGQACLPTHTCVPATCLDSMRDGSETDVDCGGACPGCSAGKACAVDQDCTSMGCDTASLTCVADPCTDHHRDGDETDVDCGGSCPMPCGSEKACAVDADCLSDACDGVTLTCDDDQCTDNRRDGDESDVDCGGDICGVPCAIGKACLLDTDCAAPYACDAVSFTCVSNQCLDDQQDGNETDVDCGGTNSCLRCKIGMKCVGSTDCRAGLTCTASNTCG